MSAINYVTLKNRSTKSLTGQYDGKQHTFPPGYSGQWPEYIALKFKEQNPVMGSEDYFSGYKSYLMAIVEHGDDTDIIEPTNATQLWDETTILLPAGVKLQTIKGRGYHPVQDRGRPAPAIADATGSRMVQVESVEPQPGFAGTETVTIVDDFKP